MSRFRRLELKSFFVAVPVPERGHYFCTVWRMKRRYAHLLHCHNQISRRRAVATSKDYQQHSSRSCVRTSFQKISMNTHRIAFSSHGWLPEKTHHTYSRKHIFCFSGYKHLYIKDYYHTYRRQANMPTINSIPVYLVPPTKTTIHRKASETTNGLAHQKTIYPHNKLQVYHIMVTFNKSKNTPKVATTSNHTKPNQTKPNHALPIHTKQNQTKTTLTE